MLKEIDIISFFAGGFSKFSNDSYCHGNLRALQSYAGKVYEKIS